MYKLVILLLAVCSMAMAVSHIKLKTPAHYVEESPEYAHVEHAGHVVEDSDYTELYVSIATSVFDFFAKLVRAKVDLVIWLKKAVLNMIVNAIVYIQHHGHEVSGYANTFLEVMKVFTGDNDLHSPQSEYGNPH